MFIDTTKYLMSKQVPKSGNNNMTGNSNGIDLNNNNLNLQQNNNQYYYCC